ncbi:MAG: DEAD/DEAH box helicase, partial [Deltaproteobacteria bacterium]|nr:DEAD/DEAH box helicase [Deltaproteobacteria bacterium]
MLKDSPEKILKRVFGYDDFRPLQAEIIDRVLSKKNVLVIMPTGGGKSICYQIPAMIFSNLTVVVSPLISLMKDQVEQLTELGVSAVCLNSSIAQEEYKENIRLIKQDSAKLLYVSPETLLKPGILDLLSSVGVSCLAIDEAH